MECYNGQIAEVDDERDPDHQSRDQPQHRLPRKGERIEAEIEGVDGKAPQIQKDLAMLILLSLGSFTPATLAKAAKELKEICDKKKQD